LDNAIEACISDPDRTKRHAIAFKIRLENQEVVFQVIDNGQGLDNDTQKKIFTPGFISRKREGSGLGLFIAKQVLEKNNGRIDVDSSPGAGSVFTVRLPQMVGGTDASTQPCDGAHIT
jgi:signal transduction histidine kinase